VHVGMRVGVRERGRGQGHTGGGNEGGRGRRATAAHHYGRRCGRERRARAGTEQRRGGGFPGFPHDGQGRPEGGESAKGKPRGTGHKLKELSLLGLRHLAQNLMEGNKVEKKKKMNE
jgi:hypothetical protein